MAEHTHGSSATAAPTGQPRPWMRYVPRVRVTVVKPVPVTRLMRKGTRLETTSRFLHDATSVGISCRCTMILGYPGETVEDVHASADFLDRHHEVIERVMLNRFQIMVGTSFHRALQRKPNRFQGVRVMMEDQASALVAHEYLDSGQRHYRKAVMRLFSAAHRINQKSLTMRAQDFEGVM